MGELAPLAEEVSVRLIETHILAFIAVLMIVLYGVREWLLARSHNRREDRHLSLREEEVQIATSRSEGLRAVQTALAGIATRLERIELKMERPQQ